MTDLAVRVVPVPGTGEAVDLDAPLQDLARVYRETQDFEQELRTLKSILSQEIHNRMDKDGRWTEQTGDLLVKGEGPGRTEYDPDILRKALMDLEELDLITERAAIAALEIVTTFKPRKAGINALLKRGGEVEERVRAAERPVEKPRRVSVRRLSDGR